MDLATSGCQLCHWMWSEEAVQFFNIIFRLMKMISYKYKQPPKLQKKFPSNNYVWRSLLPWLPAYHPPPAGVWPWSGPSTRVPAPSTCPRPKYLGPHVATCRAWARARAGTRTRPRPGPRRTPAGSWPRCSGRRGPARPRQGRGTSAAPSVCRGTLPGDIQK